MSAGIPPAISEETAEFWAAANEGRLLAERCASCGAESFPPRGICRTCRSRSVGPVQIEGPGTIYSLTVNHQRWLPDLTVPYGVALVEFPDHIGVRITGRLRADDLDAVSIGDAVSVGFEEGPGGQAVPSFEVVL